MKILNRDSFDHVLWVNRSGTEHQKSFCPMMIISPQSMKVSVIFVGIVLTTPNECHNVFSQG